MKTSLSLTCKKGSACSLKAKVRQSIPKICLERALLVTESFKQTENLPPVLRRAYSLKHILENMTIYILNEEVIVGNLASDVFSAPLFPEYAIDWFKKEMKDIPNREMDSFEVPEDAAEKLEPVFEYWKGKTLRERCQSAIPEYMKEADRIKAIYGEHLINEGSGHLIVDFEKVLRKGIRGVADEAAQALDKVSKTDSETKIETTQFLQSVLIVCDAVCAFAERYAAEAEKMARAESDPERRAQLLVMAETCRKIPANPAGSFYEALQSVWFVQLILQIESNGHSVSLGRFDQYLYDYYRQDIDSGIIDDENALELIEHFWVKLNTINKIRPWSDTQFLTGYPMFQNVTIGGQTAYGKDAVNELTYLCLKATEEIAMTQPSLSARYWAASSTQYLTACVKCIKAGLGMPAMFNDDVIIPAFLNRGVKYSDAENYALVGCVETAVPGKWGYRCNGMSYFNMLKILELALNDGVDPATGLCLCRGTGTLENFNSMDDIWKSWSKLVEWYTECYVKHDAIVDTVIEEFCPEPFCSSLVEDCIGRGKAIMSGGAIYDMVSAQSIGLANIANALAALDKLCYTDKTVTPAEMYKAVMDNFSTPSGQRIRAMIQNDCPKYGNDIDAVDKYATRLMVECATTLDRYKNTRNGRGPIGCGWQLSTSTVTSNVPFGASIGATPDGRRSGESLAEGCSPVQGSDVSGPTASMNTIVKLPNVLISGGQLYNMKFNPVTLDSEKGIQAMIQLLRSYAAGHGWHVQFNIIDNKTLLDAQKHPENYRDLVVRVAGYSAYFVDLNETIQNDIIRRTMH